MADDHEREPTGNTESAERAGPIVRVAVARDLQIPVPKDEQIEGLLSRAAGRRPPKD
jgi:hypothetical protein